MQYFAKIPSVVDVGIVSVNCILTLYFLWHRFHPFQGFANTPSIYPHTSISNDTMRPSLSDVIPNLLRIPEFQTRLNMLRKHTLASALATDSSSSSSVTITLVLAVLRPFAIQCVLTFSQYSPRVICG